MVPQDPKLGCLKSLSQTGVCDQPCSSYEELCFLGGGLRVFGRQRRSEQCWVNAVKAVLGEF